MSEFVSPLAGRVAEGAVRVSDAGPRGMILVKGDLSEKTLRTVCKKLTGLDFPGQGEAVCQDRTALLWMAPDEVLIVLERAATGEALAQIGAAMGDVHHLAADISDARAVIRLEGAGLREVLARLTPADLHPDALPPGRLRRTRLAQVAAAFWLHDEGLAEVICFRSVADYVFDLLTNAASAPAVGHLPSR